MMRRTPPLHELEPAEAWAPWEPTSDQPWDRKWAGHLYRRAAFGASWPELQSAIDDGPEATIDRLMTGGEGQDEFDRLMDELSPESPQFQADGNEAALQSWWLHRMILTPEAELQGYRAHDLLEGILNSVPVPQERIEV